jgi:hypothetical protein
MPAAPVPTTQTIPPEVLAQAQQMSTQRQYAINHDTTGSDPGTMDNPSVAAYAMDIMGVPRQQYTGGYQEYGYPQQQIIDFATSHGLPGYSQAGANPLATVGQMAGRNADNTLAQGDPRNPNSTYLATYGQPAPYVGAGSPTGRLGTDVAYMAAVGGQQAPTPGMIAAATGLSPDFLAGNPTYASIIANQTPTAMQAIPPAMLQGGQPTQYLDLNKALDITGGTIMVNNGVMTTANSPVPINTQPPDVDAGRLIGHNKVAALPEYLQAGEMKGGIKLFTPYGNYAQTEVDNVKLLVDKDTGELGAYQQVRDINIVNPDGSYGFRAPSLVSGGGRAALQSGAFTINQAETPYVIAQENAGKTQLPSASITQNLSRLGAEAYGGYVLPLDNRTIQSTGAQYSTYANPNNLANYANPQGANMSKSQAPGANIPWEINPNAPAIGYMNQNGIIGQTDRLVGGKTVAAIATTTPAGEPMPAPITALGTLGTTYSNKGAGADFTLPVIPGTPITPQGANEQNITGNPMADRVLDRTNRALNMWDYLNIAGAERIQDFAKSTHMNIDYTGDNPVISYLGDVEKGWANKPADFAAMYGIGAITMGASDVVTGTAAAATKATAEYAASNPGFWASAAMKATPIMGEFATNYAPKIIGGLYGLSVVQRATGLIIPNGDISRASADISPGAGRKAAVILGTEMTPFMLGAGSYGAAKGVSRVAPDMIDNARLSVKNDYRAYVQENTRTLPSGEKTIPPGVGSYALDKVSTAVMVTPGDAAMGAMDRVSIYSQFAPEMGQYAFNKVASPFVEASIMTKPIIEAELGKFSMDMANLRYGDIENFGQSAPFRVSVSAGEKPLAKPSVDITAPGTTMGRVTGTKVIGGREVPALSREPSLKSQGIEPTSTTGGQSKSTTGQRIDYSNQPRGPMKPMSGVKQASGQELIMQDPVFIPETSVRQPEMQKANTPYSGMMMPATLNMFSAAATPAMEFAQDSLTRSDQMFATQAARLTMTPTDISRTPDLIGQQQQQTKQRMKLEMPIQIVTPDTGSKLSFTPLTTQSQRLTQTPDITTDFTQGQIPKRDVTQFVGMDTVQFQPQQQINTGGGIRPDIPVPTIPLITGFPPFGGAAGGSAGMMRAPRRFTEFMPLGLDLTITGAAGRAAMRSAGRKHAVMNKKAMPKPKTVKPHKPQGSRQPAPMGQYALDIMNKAIRQKRRK